MRRRKYISCVNEDAHVARMEIESDNSVKWVAGSFVLASMAQDSGWQKLENGWLCPDCLVRENWQKTFST